MILIIDFDFYSVIE